MFSQLVSTLFSPTRKAVARESRRPSRRVAWFESLESRRVLAGSITLGGVTFTDPSSDPNDGFGNNHVTLATGNVVITAPSDSTMASQAGAVYLFNGKTGNLMSTFQGSQALDHIGSGGVTALTNGNYVVVSPYCDNGSIIDAGAVTWANGTTGISGVISPQNSLVGTHSGDTVGTSGVIPLSNGNYVVISPDWANDSIIAAGAVTWANGTTGISGPITPQNSLVGTQAEDQVGLFGVTALTNGNYVVISSYWDNGSIADAGAATWANGATGISGQITPQNSLVGAQANDHVGLGGITALTNGNYVVNSPDWDNGSIADAGAATWANGTTGITGVVTPQNSLVGTHIGDQVGYSHTTALSNGNYLVGSDYWNNGTLAGAGAVTLGNGTTGIVGEITRVNSALGSRTNGNLSIANVDEAHNLFTFNENYDNYLTFTRQFQLKNGSFHEVRNTPTLAAGFVNGSYVVQDVSSTSVANHLLIRRVADNLVITDENERFFSAPVGGYITNLGHSFSIPLKLVEQSGQSVVINTGAGDDNVLLETGGPTTIDAIPSVGITLNLGKGKDTFDLRNNYAASNWDFNGFQSARVDLDGVGTINVTGLELARGSYGNDTFNLNYAGPLGLASIDGDSGSVNQLVVNRNANITLSDNSLIIAPLNANEAKQSIALSTIDFAVLNGGPGDNVIDASLFRSRTTISGGAGNDTLIGGIDNDFVGGGDGNDRLFGGAGNDTLSGGAGDDWISGETGDDTLYGFAGRDILIGGLGADTLNSANVPGSDSGDDVLIGGGTKFDSNSAAIDALLASWASPMTYTDHVQQLQTGVGPTKQYKLDHTTVFEDAAKDTLYGGGGRDWFILATDPLHKDTADAANDETVS